MRQTLVILVVGLAPRLVGAHTPNLARLAANGALRPLTPSVPAVTCTSQSTLLTGAPPSVHGAVANGWYFRDMAEVLLWRQPNQLIGGEKIWEAGRRLDPGFTCAKMFWWYNMYSSADWSATPRPQYPADGRKIPDHYAHPASLRDELNARLGMFPLFKFWGPMTTIEASQWIADATCHVMATRKPTLTLCYLPHLDYNLQRLGPDPSHPHLQQDLREVDQVCGQLIAEAERTGARIVVVSEYGITPVTDAVPLNRHLRNEDLIAVRVEAEGREYFDAGASETFAVCDHQLAHVYVKDPRRIPEIRALLEGIEGVDAVWGEEEKRAHGLDHPRSGELVAVSDADRWFSYYYWLDDAKAPDYAATVDIHRKPGYDPVEMFFDPAISMPKLRAGLKLVKRKLGFRQLMDLTSIRDTQLVRGSHGRLTAEPDGPLVISSEADAFDDDGPVDATAFKDLVLRHVFRQELS